MKIAFLLPALLAATTAFGGTLNVSFLTDPLGGNASSGTYSGYGDGIALNWSNFGATANAGAIVTTGLLTCTDTTGGCAGGNPARFRVDFTGSNFATVDIDFQGMLTSLAPLPDVIGILYGTVNTVVFTGTPNYNGNQLVEVGSDQILSITVNFGFDNPTNGKAVLANHEVTGTIPTGNFYGYTILSIESLTGELNFNDPLTNNFANASAVPEPSTTAGITLALAALAWRRRRAS